MGTRTTTNGSPTYRFTPGNPDGLNFPDSGHVAGNPPFVFMTGGGAAANTDPALTGMDRLLDKLTDEGGYTIGQANVPWYLGSDIPPYDCHGAIDDACAWLRNPANGVNASNDPPVLIGMSNGWICAIAYALSNPVTAIIGIATPVDNKAVYDTDYGGGRAVFETAWSVTYPTPLPERASPAQIPDQYLAYDPEIGQKVCAFYSASDFLFAPAQQMFLVSIGAEMHNYGVVGHGDGSLLTVLNGPPPADFVDADRMLEFVNERVATL